jgi:hypothetical protein
MRKITLLSIALSSALLANCTSIENFIQPANDKTYKLGDTLTFSWSAFSGADNYNYTFTSTNSDPDTLTTATSKSIPVTSDMSGEYLFKIYAMADSSPTSCISMSKTISVDGIKPDVSVSPSGTSFDEQTAFTLSSTDTTASIYYTIDGTTPTASSTKYTGAITLGTNTTLKVVSIDQAGNSSDVTTRELTISDSSNLPTISGVTNGGTVSSAANTVNIVIDGNVTNYQYSISPSISALTNNCPIGEDAKCQKTSYITIPSTTSDATYTLTVRGQISTTEQTYWSDEQTVSFTIDNTAPNSDDLTITATKDSSTTTNLLFPKNSTIQMSLESTNDNDDIYYTTNTGTTNNKDPKVTGILYKSPFNITSTTTLNVKIEDTYGNITPTSIQKTYIIDSVAPTVSVDIPAGIYNKTQNIQFTLSDSGGSELNASKVYYSTTATTASAIINNGSGTSVSLDENGTATSTVEIASTKTLYYVGVDQAGNEGTVSSKAYEIDQTAVVSEVENLLNINGKTFATVDTYGANAIKSIAVSGVATYKHAFDLNSSDAISDFNATATAENNDTNISLSSLEDGEHKLYIIGYDESNKSEAMPTIANPKATFTVDNTPPKTPVASYSKKYFTDTLAINVEFPTNSDAKTIYINKDGSKVTRNDYNTSITTDDGSYNFEINETTTINAISIDASGNESEDLNITFTKIDENSSTPLVLDVTDYSTSDENSTTFNFGNIFNQITTQPQFPISGFDYNQTIVNGKLKLDSTTTVGDKSINITALFNNDGSFTPTMKIGDKNVSLPALPKGSSFNVITEDDGNVVLEMNATLDAGDTLDFSTSI